MTYAPMRPISRINARCLSVSTVIFSVRYRRRCKDCLFPTGVGRSCPLLELSQTSAIYYPAAVKLGAGFASARAGPCRDLLSSPAAPVEIRFSLAAFAAAAQPAVFRHVVVVALVLQVVRIAELLWVARTFWRASVHLLERTVTLSGDLAAPLLLLDRPYTA